MSNNSEVPDLLEYKLLVKPPKEKKISLRIYASSPQDAKEQALKRWPDSKVMVIEINPGSCFQKVRIMS